MLDEIATYLLRAFHSSKNFGTTATSCGMTALAIAIMRCWGNGQRKLLAECDVHTLLRLPTGIFYAQGVKANVLLCDRQPASATPWTKKLWIYDLRTNQHFTLKQNLQLGYAVIAFSSLLQPAEIVLKSTW
jgi:hypothetical protein